MPADLLEVILQLRGLSSFVSGSQEASKAVGGVGTAAETSGKKAGAGWKGMAKWAAGAGAVYGGVRFLRSAVDATNDLAKGTYALQKQTGMDTQTASEWVALTKERGISARQLSTSIATLSRNIDKARTGTVTESKTVADLRKQIDQVSAAGGKDAPKQLAKLSAAIDRAQTSGTKARAVMAQLGVTQADLAKGNTPDVLYKLADAFQKMPPGAERTALAQKLLGRSGQQLLPVLAQGRKGVEEMLAAQKASGNYLSKGGLDAARKNVIQQRELEQAMAGLKVQLALALMPVMLAFGKVLLAIAKFLRPVTSNAGALRWIIIGLTAALTVYLGVVKGVAAYEKFAAAATKIWAATNWLLTTSLYGIPIFWIIAAIVALVAVIYLAYKHFDKIKAAAKWAWAEILAGAQFAWNWIKKNWPLLLGILGGPFTLAAALIYQHFDAIKKYVLAFVDAIKAAFADLLNYVKNIPGKLGGLLKKVPGASVASKALGWAGQKLAAGGLITRAGGFLVGERGPELVTLPPGAAVSPLPGGAELALAGGSGQSYDLVIPLIVDGRELGRAVARVTSDKLARR